MSIFVWLSVILLPTIAIPTTLTFTLSSKSKEIVDGLDKLGIVNRKERKERTTLAPTVNLPPAKPAAARPVPAKPAPTTPKEPAPTTPKEPAPTTPKEPAPTTPKEPSNDGDQDGASQSVDGDAQQGEMGEPGPEIEGPKISLADIALDSISRINVGTPLVMGGKGDILNHFEMANALNRILSVIEDLKKQANAPSSGAPQA